MALTTLVKDELANYEATKVSARKAEISTILRFTGGLHIVSGRIVVESEVDHEATAHRMRRTIAEIYGHDSELTSVSGGGLRRGGRYIVRVDHGGEALARQTGLLDLRGRPVRGLPPAVVNVVNGAGGEIGEYLATSKRIAKVAFTGSTEVGQQIMQYATQNIIPVTLELGGKSPTIFFADVMDEEDAFFDKALEGFALFAFNQGEVCTCPSRALVQESIYERFMERAIRRVESIRSGNPLDSVTQMGAQVSHGQLETILNYIDIGKKEGADVLTGGRRKLLEGELKDGYYLEPTILFGQNNMRVFQEEIFGPVLAVTTFKTMEEALELANDTQYGLGAGVWSRNGNLAYKMGRGIQAGRVWTNCYHAYPAHAAFGGYKQSGIGRETHKMMLEHYQQTKCLLVSYSDKPLGLF